VEEDNLTDMLLFDTRINMIRTILQEGMVGCELGVFAGEFAEELVKRNPKHLTLIDSWEGDSLFSGDQDGNNGASYPAFYLEEMVKQKFRDCSNVEIHKGWTFHTIPKLADTSLDYVYIDADHSYEGMKRDLELIRLKMKPYGLILGHDYEMNFEKAKYNWKFGVRQAVDEFCERHGYRLIAKAMDGCVSFCLLHSNYLSSSTSTPANL
jgi:hypothetical protein